MRMRSIRLALGLPGLGLLLLLGTALVAADLEPNDDTSSAEAMVAGTYDGSLNTTDVKDVYKLEVAGSDVIGLSFKTLAAGTQHLDVRDAAEDPVTTLESKGGVRASVNIYIGCELDMAWWFIVVSVGPEGEEAPGDYQLSLFYDLQDDGGTEGDAPCELEAALLLDAGEHTGEYGYHDQRDAYRVIVKAGWTLGLCLDCTEEAGPMRVSVYTDDDLTTPMKSMEVMDEQSCEWLLPAATPLGTNWYIVIEGVTDETHGEYVLEVDMEETDSGPPRVISVTPRKFTPGKTLKVVVTLEEDTQVVSAMFHYRKDGKGDWKELILVPDGGAFTGKVDGGYLEGAEELEYYIEAGDTTGFRGGLGSETEVETMGSTGESPGFGAAMVIMAASVMVLVVARRRSA